MLTIPKELQQVIRTSKGQPLRISDPETRIEYIILPSKVYEQIQGLFYNDTGLTNSEQQNLLIQAGLRAGWDDPEMDIYNDLDPRGES